MSRITRKSLWIDPNQGETSKGRAFGFIGTTATDDYQGWFFTWPSDIATISSVAERNSVIESLDADETCPRDPQIPCRWARQLLSKHLRAKFDLRRK